MSRSKKIVINDILIIGVWTVFIGYLIFFIITWHIEEISPKPFVCAFFILFVLQFLLVLSMFVDCIKRMWKKRGDKMLWWIILIIFGGITGATIYYLLVARKASIE